MFKVLQLLVAVASIYAENVLQHTSLVSSPNKLVAHPPVHGNQAEVGQFPYHVSLIVMTGTGPFRCSGAIISETWILTSSSCVSNASFVIVYPGVVDNPDNSTIAIVADSWIAHEDFDPSYILNDIGLVKLETTPLTFDENIQAAVLPKSEGYLDAGAAVTVTAWVQEEETVTLEYKPETTISNSDCYNIFDFVVYNGTICSQGDEGSGDCVVNGGSPLVLNPEEEPIVVGVFNFLSIYGCEDYPSGYARVSFFRHWIQEHTGL